VNKNVNIEEDYIIPSDSDEFQEFPDTLENILKIMKKEDLYYLDGCTKERVSESGQVIMIEKDKDIFEQFPKFNNKLFCQPKIGLIKAKYFKYMGVGHHGIGYTGSEYLSNEDKKYIFTKSKRIVSTNHFRWNMQGKTRIEKWIILFKDKNYKGWSDIDKYKKMLDVFNSNLLDYNK
jgi:hypothetical protein